MPPCANQNTITNRSAAPAADNKHHQMEKLIYTHCQLRSVWYTHCQNIHRQLRSVWYTHCQMKTLIYNVYTQSTEVRLIYTLSDEDIKIYTANWGQFDTHTVKWRHWCTMYTHIKTMGSRRVWPVSRGCLLLLGTWSHLWCVQRSVIAQLLFLYFN